MFKNRLRVLPVLLGICATLCTVTTHAQNTKEAPYAVSGRVIDSSAQQPVEFANVILYNLNDSVPAGFTTTNEGGYFIVTPKNPGDYRLVVSYLGYKTFELKHVLHVTAQSRKHSVGNVMLEQSDQQLNEVVVTGQRRQVIYKLDKQVIEAAGYLSAAAARLLIYLCKPLRSVWMPMER